MTAGRRGRPSSSTRTTPCIWPESPSAVTSAPRRPTAAPVASRTAAHQSSGGDSAHPGRGARTAYEAEPSPRMAPPSAISSALTELVPRSRPRSIGEAYPWNDTPSSEHTMLFSPGAQEGEPVPNEGVTDHIASNLGGARDHTLGTLGRPLIRPDKSMGTESRTTVL